MRYGVKEYGGLVKNKGQIRTKYLDSGKGQITLKD